MSSLSHDEIEALLKQSHKRTGVRRAKKVERILSVWWKLDHHLTLSCDNPDCVDPRQGETRHAITANVDEHEMCRYCFLDGYGRDKESN